MQYSILLQYSWLFFILATFANAGIWWFRGRQARIDNPEIHESFSALIKGFLFWANLPWLAMGFLSVTVRINSPFDLMKLSSGNHYAWGWIVLVVFLWILCTRWLFSGGAELLIEHPGLLNLRNPTPAKIKLMWFLCLAWISMGDHRLTFNQAAVPENPAVARPARF